jgi:DNA-binding transcriptional MerR regulator
MKKEVLEALEFLKQSGVSLSEIESFLTTEPEEKMNYFVYGIGNEGVEGVLDLLKEGDSLFSFQLRCRFNGHRNIKLYAVKTTVDRDMLWKALEDGDNKTIIEKSIEVGY